MTDQPQALSVTLTRVFEAPIDLVYRAWTDPEQVVQWMKCEPSVELVCESWQPEVGAAYATTMRKPGEWEMQSTGRFVEVDPPRLLVYTSDAKPEMNAPENTVRVELEEVDGGTKLTLTHSGLPSDEMCGIVEGGWTGGLAMLENVVLELKSA